MLERIDTICLTVSHLAKSSHWYEEIGFRVTFKGESYRVLQIGNSDVSLTLEEGEPTSHSNRTYPIFFTKDIQETFKMFKGKGIKVTEIQEDGDNTYFDFYDLDNNKLQVCFWE